MEQHRLNWAEISRDYPRFHHVYLGYITDVPVELCHVIHVLAQLR